MDMQQPNDLNGAMGVQLVPDGWNVVLAGLNRIEHGIARPVYDSIMLQLRQQSMPRPAPVEDVDGGI